MATVEFLSITARAEKSLSSSIIEQIKLIRKEFSNFSNFYKKKDYKLIADIYNIDEQIINLNDKSQQKALENFMKAPLGKDLRRNLAYTMIIRTLRDISNSSKNIAKYINSIQGFKINKTWVNDFSIKLVDIMNLLEGMVENEEPEIINQLLDKDSGVNDIYKNMLKKFATSANTKKKLSAKEKDAAIIGFIMALKNFENIGDSIREIAQSVKFIVTGKFHD